jgi:ArsR family transcriptional regulator
MRDIVIRMAEFFKALGDPTRLKIIRMLASNPECRLCVGAIANRLGITQPAVSQHLKVLKNVGLVEPNRDGFRVHYSINTETLTEFRKNLDELCKLAFEKCPCDDEYRKQGEEISETPQPIMNSCSD